MGVDDLSKQITEYQMRVESVLNGMDTVMTSLDNRLKRLEQASAAGRIGHAYEAEQAVRIDQLERRV